MSTESVMSSGSFSARPLNLEKICSKAPQPWRKPRSRVYDYNRVLGNDYYKPMVDYVLNKNQEGIYHSTDCTKHSSDLTSSQDHLGDTDLGEFLVKGYAQQIKERNQNTANVHYHQLHGSLASTEYSKNNLVGQHSSSAAARTRWLRELMVIQREEDRVEEEMMRREEMASQAIRKKLAREEEEKRMRNPEVVAYLRGGAQAATMWCHRTPLTRAQRQARLEGRSEWECMGEEWEGERGEEGEEACSVAKEVAYTYQRQGQATSG